MEHGELKPKKKRIETSFEKRERCLRLLADERLVDALPDKGAKIKADLAAAEAAINSGRGAEPTAVPGKPRVAFDDQVGVQGSRIAAPQSTTHDSVWDRPHPAPIDHAFAMKMGEKYGDVRMNVLEELRAAFGTQLSDAEIQRLAADAVDSFPSFNETQHFQQQEVEKERAIALQALWKACRPEASH